MKIVVTGAAGYIGSNFAISLAEQGHQVVGIDNFNDYYDPRLKRLNADDLLAVNGRIIERDLASDDLTTALSGADFIFHLAAQPGISATTPFADYLRNNIIATQRLLAAAQQVKSLRLFVNIATSSVYGAHALDAEDVAPKPTSYYGVTKLAAEQLVLAAQRDQGFPATSLRIFSVYGPRERPEKLYPLLLRCLLTERPFPLFADSLNHSRSFTYVGDIIAAFTAVIAQPDKAIGEIFNIGSEQEFTTAEGIAIIEEILGRKATFAMQPRRPGDQLQTRANIAKARRLLGYNPQTPLRDGLQAMVDWYVTKIHGNF